MEVFTWPMAATAVGSVATICATIWKILGNSSKKNLPPSSLSIESKKQIAEIDKKLSVLIAQFEDHKEDDKDNFSQLRQQIKDLTDLIHDLLTKLASD